MKKKNIEKAVVQIEALLAESYKSDENAADGYDAGYYTGEIGAYENALKIIKEAMEA